MSFNKRFWPEDLYDVVCTDCFVPEFWMTQRNVTDPSCQGLYAVTGESLGGGHMTQQRGADRDVWLRSIRSAVVTWPAACTARFMHTGRA